MSKTTPAQAVPDSQMDVIDYPPSATPAIQSIARGELTAQHDMALSRPRNLDEYAGSVLAAATSDIDLAQSCVYAVPRKEKGGKQIFITGPSVRFAEIAMQMYSNAYVETTVMDIGKDFVTVRGRFYDAESNLAIGTEVSISIKTKDGYRYGNDLIQQTIQGAHARARRNAIIAGIGRWRLNPIIRKIALMSKGKPEQLPELRVACDEYIVGELGIPRTRMLNAVNATSLEDLSLDDIMELRKLAVAVNDGEAKASEVFPAAASKPTQTGGEALRDAIEAKKGASKP